MKKALQRGSLVSYGLIGVLLVAILVGGVVLVRQRSDQARQVAKTEAGESTTETVPNKGSAENDKAVSTPGGMESNSQATGDSTSGRTDTGRQEANLPQSGPVTNILSLVAIALISGLLVAYIRSIRLARATSL